MDTLTRHCYNSVLLSAIICFIWLSTSDASCSLPQDLRNKVWEYSYTQVSDSSKKVINLDIKTTTLQNSAISLNFHGSTLDGWTCINSLHISNTTTVVVFKSDATFSKGPNDGGYRLYLCMKLTRITADLYYFYLLSDVHTGIIPKERAFESKGSDPMSSIVCQYSDSPPKIRTLRKQGTNDVLPNDASLCEPWDSACDVDASCSLPTDIKNSAWQYNYTKVSDNSPQSTILRVSTTTLQNSVINLNVVETTIRDWTCIDSLTLSNTQTLVLFKSEKSFTYGPFEGHRWLYLCMKFTKVTKDLYYFYLLSDISNAVTPNERVFVSEEGNPPAYDAPMCSTFCKYTSSPKIRTLRRPETSDEIPGDAALCEPCDSACQIATTIMTPTATTQKQSIPPMSTATGTATSVIWIETTQNATKPSTSIEIDSTTDVITTGTTHKTSVKNTVSEILNHYTGLIIAGGLIISGLMVVIAIYCLIKKRQKDPSKYTSTNVTNKEEEKVSHIYSEPSEVYHEYSEPSEVYHEYSEPSEVYHEYSEPARVFHVYRGRQHGYEETIFQE